MPQILINLPDKLKRDLDQYVDEYGYASTSEAVRQGIRQLVQNEPKITVNGFTEEFENRVLEAAKEPLDQSVTLETGEDIDRYFNHLLEESKTKG